MDVQTGDLKENEQNVRNRHLEGTYSTDIQRAQSEEESWKKASYEYDAHSKKLQASLEKRKKALEALKAPRPPPTLPRKSKGKGKARESTGGDVDMDGEDAEELSKEEEEEADKATSAWLSIFPQPHELPPDFQRGADLAQVHPPTLRAAPAIQRTAEIVFPCIPILRTQQ
ncbi:hypothetical protein FA13DRAFT_1789947 [Coprinellus micaceus]|uniref:Uncharacterized protein n=1 Tax=Coprinellus micaceus TaxID=71717 RepID=A0A4Y7TH70_COPMI|nr:hypothetical protein FA13DRAFT_1789947 [Coprinellus micaceus]